ncbi:hypothetical protein CHCC20335_0991 [Bacillus paralicheniformis]|uniref:Uncharacterized protein n=1 Tax=Bacillus sonorensis L12 TaxID=1274524 RepID=M5P3Q2_9BACI|nr:hypothetical protein BSONL12_13881 [Bacillus sonorensis L12]TWK75259.1 hypothetical protein CHCC20335_0991 [Bacillus paralicheniformis]
MIIPLKTKSHEGYEERSVIPIAISRAKEWAEKQKPRRFWKMMVRQNWMAAD